MSLFLLKKLRAKSYKLKTIRGIASLPAILLFGGIIIEIGIVSALLVYYLNNTLYANRLSDQALAAAQTGIEDGILKVVQDKTCPNASCPSSYQIETTTGTATITICKDSCAGTGKTEVISTGVALTKKHKLVATLSVSQTTGEVTIDEIREEAL
jgi:predicted Zn-dependent protease